MVYRAWRKDRQFTKLVALKIAHTSRPELLQRFYQERQIIAGMEHPNIARLLDVGSTEDGAPFLVMEFVDGVPIHQYVATHHPSTRAMLALFRKICAAVSHAHRNLIVPPRPSSPPTSWPSHPKANPSCSTSVSPNCLTTECRSARRGRGHDSGVREPRTDRRRNHHHRQRHIPPESCFTGC